MPAHKTFASAGTASVLAIAATAMAPAPAAAQSVSLRDSFPIGSGGLCEAQIQQPEPGDGLFDRRYTVLCRDASAPVGTLWAVRGGQDARFAGASCSGARAVSIEGAAIDAQLSDCTTSEGARQQLLLASDGSRTFAASGAPAYADALRLGLATLAADRPVAGEISIPLTQTTDAAAFARQQAEAISADAALVEAYRRSNEGKFAEAAAFFAASASAMSGASAAEAQLNAALQQSNLGNYLEAARLFAAAQGEVGADPVLVRLSRNFEALDALNRNDPAQALDLLQQPLPDPGASEAVLGRLELDSAIVTRLSAEQGGLLGDASGGLTPPERAQLLDGQANAIAAIALRQQGDGAAATAALNRADTLFSGVRGGRVTSILWLRAQVLAELAELAESRGAVAEAEGLHTQAIGLLEANYPGTPALQSARAQLAALYARRGRADEAVQVYRELVEQVEDRPAASLRRLLAPYFAILSERQGDERAAADMFAASQLLLRPGLAQTQAILARELSGGSDEAAQLFRRATNLARAIEQSRTALARLEARAELDPGLATRAAEKRTEFEALQARQLELQEQLAAYPRYRVVNEDRMTLDTLRAALRPGEAYVKMAELDNAIYAVMVTPDDATGYRVDATPAEMEAQVDALRETIAVIEDGQTVTYPFDLAGARSLYSDVFGPVATQLEAASHLIFEPDGAMLRLPANLLVMDDDSVRRYEQRADSAPYDFRDTAWVGRAMQVTTTVSPSAFRDVRVAPRSGASGEYIGFGENTPISAAASGATPASGTRAAMLMNASCTWGPGTWNDPIEADELYSASQLFQMGGASAQVVTGEQFTDTALSRRDDLDEYRILHFATHGLVTAPRPQCPPRPALLTSFGEGDSDGLLSFAEIYDLRIDADLVILSACDTAGTATVGLTREAGLTSGGDFALDGLVRAFVGAGGRSVVASHWPVPDDFDATKRLITGLFQAAPGTATGEALRTSQLALMDDADTSHPFYWSAFAIVGDGSVPVRQ